jgi:hypothetical protein
MVEVHCFAKGATKLGQRGKRLHEFYFLGWNGLAKLLHEKASLYLVVPVHRLLWFFTNNPYFFPW